MSAFLLRRLAVAVLLVFVVSSSALVLARLAPGDVTAELAPALDTEARARLRADLGLDRPFAAQYLSWLSGVARFDFGRSLLYSRPVAGLVGERMLNTAVLAAAALAFATLVGVPLGLYTGSRRGAGAAAVRAFSVLMLSVPPLVGSLVLVLVAARTGWAEVGGMASIAAADLGWTRRLADLAAHLPVPVLALALPMAATLERLQSQSLGAALAEPFVAASRARGAAPAAVVFRHAWPVALGPVLGLYGVLIGSLLSGSFVVEVVTSWPGLGRLMFDALRARDLYLVAGCAAAGAFVLAAGTLAADLALAWVDPRARAAEHAR